MHEFVIVSMMTVVLRMTMFSAFTGALAITVMVTAFIGPMTSMVASSAVVCAIDRPCVTVRVTHGQIGSVLNVAVGIDPYGGATMNG